MVDFLMISTRSTKRGVIEIYPKFIIKKSSDLMIRGGDFYAIWLEDRGLWSTDEQDAIHLIDRELDKYAEENGAKLNASIKVLHMWDAESGIIDAWHRYCQRQMRDSFNMLDETVIFSNHKTKKKDYASKTLDYPLEEGDIFAYDRMMSVLYSEEERHKIEWAIGSVVSGDSKKIQKFLVLYGAAGTGKSTVLTIIEQLFKGYYSVFDAKALGSSNNSFALEAFRSNPLVAIQHDGDLSRIEDNTRLNSLVAHELMTVNEKFKSTYAAQFKSFLFMGTNKPVKITDAKSGLIRRLIDVSPTGEKLNRKEYDTLKDQIKFELGAIAYHCHQVYLSDPHKYDDYIPINMLGASNDFYNFVIDSYHIFKEEDGVSSKVAWEMYKTYCDDAKVSYPLPQRAFKEELKNYFREYKERAYLEDGTRVRSYYEGFRYDKFLEQADSEGPEKAKTLTFEHTKSIFDKVYKNCTAQYAGSKEIPKQKWDLVTTTLSDIDTSELHYVKPPENHIVMDFDFKDDEGQKNLALNIIEASKWPPTYAELSKSGNGIHLHYIYTGDVSQLEKLYSENIEIKTFTGRGSLRRKLTKCNDLEIATISSGLPLKGVGKLINFENIKSEKELRRRIIKNLKKEVHPNTKPSIDFIKKILDGAYESGLVYDVSDMRGSIFSFAASSTNQSDYCIKLVGEMKFISKESPDNKETTDRPMVFFDVEVFPNLFLLSWKTEGEDKKVSTMINPGPEDVEQLISYWLVGYNCRRYDNHILYAALLGYDNEQIYNLSQKIIKGDRNCFFKEAYNLSYTDVYDFSSIKQSLKKFEVDLGIHHKELGLPWDEPVPEKLWPNVADYCKNDVLATEAVFNDRKSDFLARQILADVAKMTVNDTTNTLTTRIIFGSNRNPKDRFNYRFLGELEDGPVVKLLNFPGEHNIFDKRKRPIFPGYTFEAGKSTYRGEVVGEGGYVYSEPGMYGNVALLDIASMHPSSIVAEQLFGEEYTSRFKELMDARIAVKERDFETAKKMLNGALKRYLEDETMASGVSDALKIAINSVYGLTSASFDNAFRDFRNKDNIVAKRGALFMINLKHEVQKKGFTVAHIKTDSIKIPDATPEIIKFITDYGKEYGYIFKHEATFDKFCLVNDAVYIAKYSTVESCIRLYGESYVHSNVDVVKDCKKHGGKWTATGTQFQVPYVFKTLFSKEDILFDDMCEVNAVQTAIFIDLNEGLPEGESKMHFVGKVGRFCPMLDGFGGGILLREQIDKKTGEKKYYSVSGTKNYRWLESEVVKELGKENGINRAYYDALVKKARDDISYYGEFDWFVSDKKYDKHDNGIYPF